MWYQEMQVLCNWNHISRFDYYSWWHQDEFCEDWSNHQLKKLTKCSWCTSIFQICKFLSTIHTTLLKDCMISCEFDKEGHEIPMRYHVWTRIQQLEETIHNGVNTRALWPQSGMRPQSWLIQSCPGRCALTIWQEWYVTPSCLLFTKTECCWIKLQDLWQRTARDNIIF